ncbi:hypothetical protein CPHLJ_5g3610 [Cryptosporidium parvum]|uniref:Uncharacterized protein n=2 Tax=Cryptosporidium TaxID=5806 RepID=A0A7S7RGE1_CRYPV|nr:Uncharacterized protein CPATCC_0025830 [Cryptosporidium parvum]WKS78054.1 hypothetical protein CPCDC_5g3610 [Cryptosporidium sp. 43IA8]WRK32545.1 Uncharacterized protein cpbgf_5003610 [Cryptosporidium parvum]|eukprot:QOY41833.1 hypothetical protein CPATCC_002434 [Cryptosporidium parvum]
MGNTNEKVNISEKDMVNNDSGGAKLKKEKGEITKEMKNKANKSDEKEKIKVSKGKGELEKEGNNDEKKSKKQIEKIDIMNDNNTPEKHEKRDSVVKFEIPLKDKLSLKRRCRLNIPPCSRVPEPDYEIKLLINDKYDGPFKLEMKNNPCEIHITGFEGILLKRIKKRDIMFVQTIKNECIRMFIKGSEDQESDNLTNSEQLDSTNMYTSQYLGEVMQIICKFVNKQDCESFEFFFPFIYGLIVHSDKVKIPVSDFVDFGEYVIGTSKHILKRLDEYKNFNDNICEDNMSIDEENEDDLLDSYEKKMIAQEREFFSRSNLELIYRAESPFGLEIPNSSDDNIEDKEEEERILREKQEKYSKFFPVTIIGEAESGGIITFKDISSIGLKYVPEVIEWRISKNIGGNKAEYEEIPISVSKSFQINIDHVGRYIQARVFRHIGQDLTDTYIFSEAQSNIIIPGDQFLVNVSELLIYGKVYKVDISTYDALLLLSVQNPTYYIGLMRQYNYYDTYAYSPMVSCILDIKHSNIKLLIPTPSILKGYYYNSKMIPLCFSYSEFIMTKKSDWFGYYNEYPQIYECIMRQGELLGKVSLVLSVLEGQRKDISIYFSTEREKNIVYFSLLFRQLSPNFSLEEMGRESKSSKFVNFKKQFMYCFKKVNWRSRLLLLTAQQAGTYIKELGKIAKYDPNMNKNPI